MKLSLKNLNTNEHEYVSATKNNIGILSDHEVDIVSMNGC